MDKGLLTSNGNAYDDDEPVVKIAMLWLYFGCGGLVLIVLFVSLRLIYGARMEQTLVIDRLQGHESSSSSGCKYFASSRSY